MTTYTIPLVDGLEASISVERSLQGLRAHTLIFNDDADVVTEGESIQYMDYCATEVCKLEISRLVDGDIGNVWDALAAAGMPECLCE